VASASDGFSGRERHRPSLEGDCGDPGGRGNGPRAAIFRRGASAPLCIAKQNSLREGHPPLALRPGGGLPGARPPGSPLLVAAKAARGAANQEDLP